VTGTLFSGRREGLALYFARLVRPFWKARLTEPEYVNQTCSYCALLSYWTITSSAGRQHSNISDRVLAVIQKNLQALKDFLDKNPHLFHLSPGDLVVARTTTLTEQDAWKVYLLCVAH
jgi:nuclear pore complex protein Nup155